MGASIGLVCTLESTDIWRLFWFCVFRLEETELSLAHRGEVFRGFRTRGQLIFEVVTSRG